jgi:hypothetical protein
MDWLTYHCIKGNKKPKTHKEEDPSTTKAGSGRLWSILDCDRSTTNPCGVPSCAEWLMLVTIYLAGKNPFPAPVDYES